MRLVHYCYNVAYYLETDLGSTEGVLSALIRSYPLVWLQAFFPTKQEQNLIPLVSWIHIGHLISISYLARLLFGWNEKICEYEPREQNCLCAVWLRGTAFVSLSLSLYLAVDHWDTSKRWPSESRCIASWIPDQTRATNSVTEAQKNLFIFITFFLQMQIRAVSLALYPTSSIWTILWHLQK